MQEPLISVVMSVYNTSEIWLRNSIESILNQTYERFEFIIVLDSPTDNSELIVKEYAKEDKRIKIYKNAINMGLPYSLNKGIEVASGDFIARMDSDDISVIDRLEKQITFMLNNDDVAVVGSYISVFGSEKITIGSNQRRDGLEEMKSRMLFVNAGIPHPTAFIRKKFIDEYNIKYNEKLRNAQDYGLWVDIVRSNGVIYRIPEVLLFYRKSEKQISTKNKIKQQKFRNEVILKQLKRLIQASPQELCIHLDLLHPTYSYTSSQYIEYLNKLINENDKKKIYDVSVFKNELSAIWLKFLLKGLLDGQGFKNFKNYFTIESFMNCEALKIVIREYYNYLKYKKTVKKFNNKHKQFYFID